ncbi:hypothetical protein [Gelidibacter maritimus]|uniref:Uncharacterized protein n=1 Tax=Gelidibacter maritimus TaxID=2761487 RepID=A0A7W2R352_9FLAO|nr:hypothetical protein [Gelidibacter maritimus]MBA6152472.1 hypothetical protein [Gelidibacter maritimus]
MKNFVILILGVAIGGLAVYFYCCQSKTELIVSAPKGLISADQAKALDQAYNARHRLISDSLVKREGGDNRSSWYGLDEVRNYLNYAEKDAKEKGYTMNGIRLYLGAHPIENDKPGYTTVFFIPTGTPNKANAALVNFSMQSDGGDIPGGEGLDYGNHGYPPGANYPQ